MTPEAPPPAGRFTAVNEHFCCDNCGFEVPPRRRSCRNHCPRCLVSKHVDVYPGDRSNDCQGLMDAVGYELDGKKGLTLVFRCRRCAQLTRNVAAEADPDAPDEYDLILRIGARTSCR